MVCWKRTSDIPRRRFPAQAGIQLAKECTVPPPPGPGLRHPAHDIAHLWRSVLEIPSHFRITHARISTSRQLERQGGVRGRPERVVRLVGGRERVRVGDRRRKGRGTGCGCGGRIADLACSPCRPGESTKLCRPLAAVGESLQARDRLTRSRIRRCVGFEHRQRPLDAAKGPQTHGAQVVLCQSYRIRFTIHASTSRAAAAFGKGRTAKFHLAYAWISSISPRSYAFLTIGQSPLLLKNREQ